MVFSFLRRDAASACAAALTLTVEAGDGARQRVDSGGALA